MKTILLTLLMLPTFLLCQSNKIYFEGNVGLSTTAIETGIDPTYATMTYDKKVRTNVSILLGKEFQLGDYSLVDLQVGLCYPYIVTGKIGAGNYYGKNDQFALVLGLRPYPLAGYAQFNVGKKDGTRLIISTELGSGGQIFMGTTSLFNAGLRIPLK